MPRRLARGVFAATVITAIAGSLIYRDRLDLDSLVTWIASSGAPARSANPGRWGSG